jgi:hypothetical protein
MGLPTPAAVYNSPVIFSVLAILALLLGIGAIATYLHLSPRREEEQTEQDVRDDGPEEPGPVLARPLFAVIRAGNSLPIGTVLMRNHDTSEWTTTGLDRYTETWVRGLVSRDEASFVSELSSNNSNRALSSIPFPAREVAANMQAMQRDFRALAEDFRRALAIPVMARIQNPLEVRVGNATGPAAPRPAPIPPPAPTPKSAVDRLLSDDSLISEDDVGVKPKT